MRAFNRLYKHIDNGGICVYCGVPATTSDHFVPLSVVSALSGVLTKIHGRVLVPACGECNATAGARSFVSVAAKRRFIHWRYREKYGRLLASPRWDQDEIDALGYTLRTTIISGEVKREWIKQRLAWKNNSNPSAVRIAAIRSNLGAFGNVSARQRVKTLGTQSPDPRPSNTGADES